MRSFHRLLARLWTLQNSVSKEKVIKKPETIAIQIFAGPGSGKSTLAAELYVILKKMGADVELVQEFAKKFAWLGQLDKLGNQKFITNGQTSLISMFIGKIKLLAIDSPTLLGLFYCKNDKDRAYVIKTARKEIEEGLRPINIYIEKNGKEYDQRGRVHSKEQSEEIDKLIHDSPEITIHLTVKQDDDRVLLASRIIEIAKEIYNIDLLAS